MGYTLSGKAVKRIRDGLHRLDAMRVDRRPMRRKSAGGLQGNEPPPISNVFIPARVYEEFGDYLRCRRYYSETSVSPNNIYVAKSYLLRQTPFDGETIDGYTYAYAGVNDRTVARVSDSEVETQMIIPVFRPKTDDWDGDIIYIVRTTVYGIVGPTTGDPPEPLSTLVYMDVNVDGRAWARYVT